MYERESEIRRELISLSEENFKKFATSLIPGCENLIGVRIPMGKGIVVK